MNQEIDNWMSDGMNGVITERTNERTSERTNERTNEWTKEQTNEWMNERTNEWTNERTKRNINTTIQTSQLNSFLDFKVAYLTSFRTISKCFTNFVGDRHSFFVFKIFHVNNNSKTYLDTPIAERKKNSI